MESSTLKCSEYILLGSVLVSSQVRIFVIYVNGCFSHRMVAVIANKRGRVWLGVCCCYCCCFCFGGGGGGCIVLIVWADQTCQPCVIQIHSKYPSGVIMQAYPFQNEGRGTLHETRTQTYVYTCTHRQLIIFLKV